MLQTFNTFFRKILFISTFYKYFKKNMSINTVVLRASWCDAKAVHLVISSLSNASYWNWVLDTYSAFFLSVHPQTHSQTHTYRHVESHTYRYVSNITVNTDSRKDASTVFIQIHMFSKQLGGDEYLIRQTVQQIIQIPPSSNQRKKKKKNGVLQPLI